MIPSLILQKFQSSRTFTPVRLIKMVGNLNDNFDRLMRHWPWHCTVCDPGPGQALPYLHRTCRGWLSLTNKNVHRLVFRASEQHRYPLSRDKESHLPKMQPPTPHYRVGHPLLAVCVRKCFSPWSPVLFTYSSLRAFIVNPRFEQLTR